MYKLLIVEDEKWEREGLVDFLDWSEHDIKIVGTATNGVQGLKIAKEHLPEIIITDIKMPIMDGLELSENVKRFLPGCRIIIITGYDDFEYAKNAIQLGVCEYLLKPVQRFQLLDALSKTITSIARESRQTKHMHTLKRQLAENVYEDRERFLLDILADSPNYKKNSKIMADLGISFCEQEIVAVVMRFGTFSFYRGMEQYEKQVHFRELFRLIRKVVGDEGIAAQYNAVDSDIVICLPAGGKGRTHINDVIRRIRQECYGADVPESVTGIGPVSKTLAGFTESFIQAKAALDNIFFMKEAEILFFDDAVFTEETYEPEVSKFLATAACHSKKILNAVVSSDSQEVSSLAEELFEFIYNSSVKKSLVCNYFADLINELSVLMLSLDGSLNLLDMIRGDVLETLDKFIKLENLKKWFQGLLVNANCCFFEKRNNRKEYIVADVMDIIKNEYNCNIGVENIAHRLDLSPNYLGSLFKQHTGKRFTEVLTEFRMKKAEEFLVLRTGSIMDIANAVGYANTSYFCTMFKKTHGISPMNYQERYSHENMEA